MLEALVKLHDDLVEKGVLSDMGSSYSKISYGLDLNEKGELVSIISLMDDVVTPKGKTITLPRQMMLPAPAKRTSKIISNFLWDNAAYMLGLPIKGDQQSAADRFYANRDLCHEVLDGLDSVIAKSILAFVDHWNPFMALEHPQVEPLLDDLKTANLTFLVTGAPPYEDGAIKAAWQRYYDKNDAPFVQDAITGEKDRVAMTHPLIRGFPGGPGTGTNLISFGKEAFESHGQEQGMIASIGQRSAFAYTDVLNYMIANRMYRSVDNDTYVFCWADGGDILYTNIFQSLLYDSFGEEQKEFRDAAAALAAGRPVNQYDLMMDKDFYVLGLGLNSKRLVVRFFYHNSFGKMLSSVKKHHDGMTITKPEYEKYDSISMNRILRETVPQRADAPDNPKLAQALYQSILSGTQYPIPLIYAITQRALVERKVTYPKAAFIKAYYLRNTNKDVPEEVLKVGLNEEARDRAYVLGRLLAIYDEVQKRVNPNVQQSVGDKFFHQACTTPGLAFPYLNRLNSLHIQNHRLSEGSRVYYTRIINELQSRIGVEYPRQLNLAQQGSFQLGYYMQYQRRFEKRKKDDNDDNGANDSKDYENGPSDNVAIEDASDFT